MNEEQFCPIISKEKPMLCKKNCKFYNTENRTCCIQTISKNLQDIKYGHESNFKKGFFRTFGMATASLCISFIIFILITTGVVAIVQNVINGDNTSDSIYPYYR